MSILSIIKGNLIMEITTNGVCPKLYRLNLASNELASEPECITELVKNNGHGFAISSSLDSAFAQNIRGYLSVLEKLSFKPNEPIKDFETINLSSGGSLRLFFEAGYRKKNEIAESLPNPSDYNYGDIVLFNENILVFRDEVQKSPSWRVLPRNGNKLSPEEIAFLCKELKLKKRLPQAEENAFHFSRSAFRGSDKIVETIKEKLGDPENTEKTEYSLPSGRKLFVRMTKGGRLWVAIPENGILLNEDEKKEIEDTVGLKLAFNLERVKKGDIVCWGDSVEEFFRGTEKSIIKKISAKLSDPVSCKEDTVTDSFTFDDTETKITFSKKVNKAGHLVWTVSNRLHKQAAGYFDLARKNFLRTTPEDAIFLWGTRTKEFWEMPNESKRYGLVHFQRIIIDLVGKPTDFDDAYIKIINRTKEEKVELKIYLGEDPHGRFWYIEKKDLGNFVKITGLVPKDSKNGLLEHVALEDEFFQRIIDVQKNEKPQFDSRDDGTDRKDLQLIRGGRRIARVREGLEPNRKKRKN